MAAKRAVVLASLIGLLPGASLAQVQALTGGEIRDRMINATIQGTNLQGKYQETYRADGKIEGLLEGQPYDGKWDVKGDQMCFYYNDMLFACSGISIVDGKLSFLSSGEVVAEATYEAPPPVQTATVTPPAEPVPPPPPPAPPEAVVPPPEDERAVIPVPTTPELATPAPEAPPAVPAPEVAIASPPEMPAPPSVDGGAKAPSGITTRPTTTIPPVAVPPAPALETAVVPPPVPDVPGLAGVPGIPGSPKAEIEQILKDFAPEMQVVVGDVTESGNDLLISRIDLEIDRGLVALEEISIQGGNRANAKAIFNPESYAGGPRGSDFLPLFDRLTVKRIIVSPPDAPTSTFGTFSIAALAAKPFAKPLPVTAQGMNSLDESQALDVATSFRFAGITFDDLFVAVPSGHPDPVNPADAQYFMKTGRIAIGAYDPRSGLVPESVAMEKVDMKVPGPTGGNDVPATLARAAISNVKFHEGYPIAGRVELLGFSTPASVADTQEARDTLMGIGLDKLEFDAVLDIAGDVAAKTAAINEFRLRWAGMGTTTLNLQTAGVDIPAAIAGNPMIMMAATLVSANFSYSDDGGLDKIILAGAKESGQTPDAVRQGLIQNVEQNRGMATHPALVKAVDDVLAFLKRPGTFEMALKPPQPVPMATFASNQPPDPNQMVDTLGFSTSVR